MEAFIRKQKETEEGNLLFQVLSWEAFDETIEHDTSDFEESNLPDDNRYHIYAFGVNTYGESVCVRFENYKPYFFALIPDKYQKTFGDFEKNEVERYIRNKLFKNKEDLESVSIVKRKKYKGFTNGKEYKFLRFVCKNLNTFNRIKYILNPKDKARLPKISKLSSTESLKFDLYESNIEPYLRFTHKMDIKMASWLEVNYITQDNEMSRCQHSYICHYNNVKLNEKQEVCNLTLGAWDIEAFSHSSRYLNANDFPDPEKPNDIITQIGTSLYKFGTKEKIKHVVTIKSPIDNDCDPVDCIIIEQYDSEKELIIGWVKFILKTDPDILVQYNGYDFDWKYVCARAKVLGIEYILENLSRVESKRAYLHEDQLNTSAYGDNTMKYLKMFGVTQFDLMFLIKKEHKLESYKLNSVAEHFTGEKKDDLSPADLFNFNTSTKDKIALVVKYCAQDTWLLIELMLKLNIVTNMIGMANITMVPMQYIELRGQQIRVHTQIAYETKKENFLIPAVDYKPKDSEEEDEKFTGATVLNAQKGAHFEPIAGLDFASLYPSIMIAHNYDYSTIVENREFDNLAGVEYEDVTWEEETDSLDEDDNPNMKTITVRFVQNQKGIMPKILERLWKERKAVRKIMKTLDPNSNMYAVHNGVQLAIKVSMNSIYGFTGAKYGRLPNKKIAAAVTACGRSMIAHSKSCAEQWYDCEVVYGDTDSIYVKFKSDLKGQAHMDYVFKVAPECADRISATFKKPIELEFEKVMYPFILYSKKRYASLFWTNPKSYDYIDYKGIQVVRRDNCNFVRDNSKKIFEYIFLNEKVLKYDFESVDELIETSKEFARDKIRKLVNAEVPMKELLLSKSLRAGYAFDRKVICSECSKTYYELSVVGKKEMDINVLTKKSVDDFIKTEHECPGCKKMCKFIKCPANIPHVALARTRERRDKMDRVASGDRIPYVFVTYEGSRQFEKVEDPAYVLKNNIPIDYLYYFEHQFKSAIETIFDPMLENVSELWKDLIPEKQKKKRVKKNDK
jgi:DNA polymerase delta subunit 1